MAARPKLASKRGSAGRRTYQRPRARKRRESRQGVLGASRILRRREANGWCSSTPTFAADRGTGPDDGALRRRRRRGHRVAHGRRGQRARHGHRRCVSGWAECSTASFNSSPCRVCRTRSAASRASPHAPLARSSPTRRSIALASTSKSSTLRASTAIASTNCQ